MNTPILLIIFNRPDKVRMLIEALRSVRPARLYVAADGPRDCRIGESELCAETRNAIDAIDWPCEVFKDYAESNLGCGPRPATAISWVFEHEERAIILEDDCIPDPSFFPFCEELLERFQDDQRIMQICGSNHLGDGLSIAESYFFSNFALCWGWATWKRAWRQFDYSMNLWQLYREQEMLKNVLKEDWQLKSMSKKFDKMLQGDDSVWDYRWLFTVWANHGLCIIPNHNLISNVGFGADATHTFVASDTSCMKSVDPIQLPLIHPAIITPQFRHDVLMPQTIMRKRTFVDQVKAAVKKSLPASVVRKYHLRKYGFELQP